MMFLGFLINKLKIGSSSLCINQYTKNMAIKNGNIRVDGQTGNLVFTNVEVSMLRGKRLPILEQVLSKIIFTT